MHNTVWGNICWFWSVPQFWYLIPLPWDVTGSFSSLPHGITPSRSCLALGNFRWGITHLAHCFKGYTLASWLDTLELCKDNWGGKVYPRQLCTYQYMELRQGLANMETNGFLSTGVFLVVLHQKIIQMIILVFLWCYSISQWWLNWFFVVFEIIRDKKALWKSWLYCTLNDKLMRYKDDLSNKFVSVM